MRAFGGMFPREIFPDAVDRIVEPSGRCMSMGLWCGYFVVSSVVGAIMVDIFQWHRYRICNRLWGCWKKVVGLQYYLQNYLYM